MSSAILLKNVDASTPIPPMEEKTRGVKLPFSTSLTHSLVFLSHLWFLYTEDREDCRLECVFG
jgi:hypothetical protein